MFPQRIAFALMATFACLASAPGRAQIESACFGLIDYAHELSVGDYTLLSSTPIDGELRLLSIEAQVTNLSDARFLRATGTLDVGAGDPFGLEPAHPLARPLRFGAIAPGESKVSLAPMRLVLPDRYVGDLLRALARGDIPSEVHATEELIPARAVRLGYFAGIEEDGRATVDPASGEVIAYQWPASGYADVGAVSFEVVSPAPGGSVSVGLLEDPWNERWYVLKELFAEDSGVPSDLRRGLVAARFEARCDDCTDGTFLLERIAHLDQQTALPTVFRSGAFCTAPETPVDPMDGASRLVSVDGEEFAPEQTNHNTQAIRFNDLPLGDGNIIISGQVHGHAFKPRLDVIVRPGRQLRLVGEVDNELSVSASAAVKADWTGEESLDLFDMCFPLPPLILGPIEIPLSLHLGHDIGISATARSAMVASVRKRLRAGYAFGYDSARPSGDRFFIEPFHESSPIEFTPPRLLDDSGAAIALHTDARVTLNVGTGAAPDGTCLAAAGPYLEARASGKLRVSAVDNPWWTVGHDAGLRGGVAMELLGLPVFDLAADPSEFPGEEELSGYREDTGRGSNGLTAGGDHRWAIDVEDIVQNPPGEMETNAVAATADGGVITVSSAPPRITAVDALGRYQWDYEYRLGYVPLDVFVAEDATIYVAGAISQVGWLAAHEPDGTLRWVRSHEFNAPERCLLEGAAMGAGTGGAPTFVFAGSTVAQQPRGCAFKLDENGDLLWGKRYEPGLAALASGADTDGDGIDDEFDNCPWHRNGAQDDGNGDGVGDVCDSLQQTISAVTGTRDGGFLLSGELRDDVYPFYRSNAFALRLDAHGNALWGAGYYGRPVSFEAAAEAADGSFYLTGFAGGNLNDTQAGMLVARLEGNGRDGAASLVFGDDDWESHLSALDYADPASIVREYNDRGADVVAVPGGAVVVGNVGAEQSSVSAGVVLKLNERLATEWHTVWDGLAHGDRLQSIATTLGGYVVSGRSYSLAQDNRGSLHVLKIPHDGVITPLPQVELVARRIATGATGERGEMLGFEPQFLHGVDALPSDLGAPSDLLVGSGGLCVTVLTESGSESTLDDC